MSPGTQAVLHHLAKRSDTVVGIALAVFYDTTSVRKMTLRLSRAGLITTPPGRKRTAPAFWTITEAGRRAQAGLS
mgnify:CR=1 FL=1